MTFYLDYTSFRFLFRFPWQSLRFYFIRIWASLSQNIYHDERTENVRHVEYYKWNVYERLNFSIRTYRVYILLKHRNHKGMYSHKLMLVCTLLIFVSCPHITKQDIAVSNINRCVIRDFVHIVNIVCLDDFLKIWHLTRPFWNFETMYA